MQLSCHVVYSLKRGQRILRRQIGRIPGLNIHSVHHRSHVQPSEYLGVVFSGGAAEPCDIVPIHRRAGVIHYKRLQRFFTGLLAMEANSVQALLLLQQYPCTVQILCCKFQPVIVKPAVPAALTSPRHKSHSRSPISCGQSYRHRGYIFPSPPTNRPARQNE